MLMTTPNVPTKFAISEKGFIKPLPDSRPMLYDQNLRITAELITHSLKEQHSYATAV